MILKISYKLMILKIGYDFENWVIFFKIWCQKIKILKRVGKEEEGDL
jgi:hypothetical protein